MIYTSSSFTIYPAHFDIGGLSMRKLMHWLILVTLLIPTAVWAGEPIDESGDRPAPRVTEPVRKVAIVPMTFFEKDGSKDFKVCENKTAITTTKTAIVDMLHLANLEIVDENVAAAEWNKHDGSKDPDVLPDPAELLHFGRALDADFVIVGITKWEIKTKWVGLGPKTKAYCHVDALIIDVNRKEVVDRANDIQSDSTRREQSWETAAALFVSWGFTLFSGGPKTPHMERSGQQAWSLVLKPFLESKIPPEKIRELEKRSKKKK